MSTATQPPLTRQRLTEPQLIAGVIIAISLLSISFALEGFVFATGLTLGGVAVSCILAKGIQTAKYTNRASSRVALAGSILALFAGGAIVATGNLVLVAVLLSTGVGFASIQLLIYF